MLGTMSAGGEIANRADDTSSSQGLSSPPSANSPSQQNNPPAAGVSHVDASSRAVTFEQDDALSGGGGVKTKKTGPTETLTATRKPRKKREPDGHIHHDISPAFSATTIGLDGKPKKPRAARGTSAAYLKKMQKKAEEEEARRVAEAAAVQAARVPKPEPPVLESPLPAPSFGVPPIALPPQNGNREAIQNPITNYTQNHASQQQAQRPASGQNYDPIRSSTVAPRPASPMNVSLSTPSKLAKHSPASASPSISSLIDPPDAMRPMPYNFPEYPKHGNDLRAGTPPEAKRPRMSPPDNIPSSEPNRSGTPNNNASYLASNGPIPRTADVMDIDTDTSVAGPKPITKKPSPNDSAAVSTASHSPKPSRPIKDAPVALPGAGSGLLSGSIFGSSGLDHAAGAAPSAPTVVLDIPLTGESNQYINFSELAEKRYGFNALHPRLAAQRKRLADVAALGAAIENSNKNGSGMSTDERSVDLSNDDGEDSNVEMGGMNGPAKSGEDTGEPTAKPRKKRMMKEDMYDKDDGFVDDTELAWEEQAAVSKDGFFVYSGLLVPEGEEAKVERCVRPLPILH